MTWRRGFTLVELIVALSLALAVAGVIHRTMVLGLRSSRAQTALMALHDNVRVAALVVAGELAGVGNDEITPEASAALGYPVGLRSDLLEIQPGAVTYRAERGSGQVCGVSPGAPAEIVVAASSWQSSRAPRVTDSLLVFAESDSLSSSDDAWVHLGIVSTGPAGCPGDGAAIAFRVGIPPLLQPSVLSGVTPGAPVRLAEVMQLRYYESDGKSWLGMRSVSTGESITPFAGPFADSSAGARGVTLVYRDALGEPTSAPEAVRAVEIVLVGVTDQAIIGHDLRRPLVDSLALLTAVALRNTLRP